MQPTQDPRPDTVDRNANADAWRLLSAGFCQPDQDMFDADVPRRLATALAALDPACAAAGRRLEAAAAETSPDALLIEYARLFVGPFALPAPPYASVYLEAEGLVQGASTRDVERMYAALGQTVDPELHEPADHVALELEFLSFLEQTRAREASPDTPDVAHLSGHFQAHARAWMPSFCARIRANGVGGFYDALAGCLECALEYLAPGDPAEPPANGRPDAAGHGNGRRSLGENLTLCALLGLSFLALQACNAPAAVGRAGEQRSAWGARTLDPSVESVALPAATSSTDGVGAGSAPVADTPLPTLSQADYPQFEVGGQYRVMFNANNFGFHPGSADPGKDTESFANQRFRTRLDVRTSPEVEAHLEIEMGHIAWGDDFEFTKTFAGPRFPAAADPTGDRVGVEIRRAYLGYEPQPGDRYRIGIQDWQDSFGQTLASSDWDFNVGGVRYMSEEPGSDVRLSAGGFSLWEGDASKSDDAYLLAFDIDKEVSEDTSLGLSAYYLRDGGTYSYPTQPVYDDAWDLWLGVRGRTRTGESTLNGFLIFNPGEREEIGGGSNFRHAGFAAGVQSAEWSVGSGKLDLQVLYSTGEGDPTARSSSEFRTVAQSARDGFGGQGYWSYLPITSPHGPSDVADLGVSLQNQGLGLGTLQGRYRQDLNERLASITALGWLQAAEDSPLSGEAYMGFEVAQTFAWDLGGGLTLEFGAAHLFTGDFYRDPAVGGPDDLWQVFSRLQLGF